MPVSCGDPIASAYLMKFYRSEFPIFGSCRLKRTRFRHGNEPAFVIAQRRFSADQVSRISTARETASGERTLLFGAYTSYFSFGFNKGRKILFPSRDSSSEHARVTFHAHHIMTPAGRIVPQDPKDSVRRCSGASPTRVLACLSLRPGAYSISYNRATPFSFPKARYPVPS